MRYPKCFYKKRLVVPSRIFQKSRPAINKGGLQYVQSIASFISFFFFIFYLLLNGLEGFFFTQTE